MALPTVLDVKLSVKPSQIGFGVAEAVGTAGMGLTVTVTVLVFVHAEVVPVNV